MTRALVWCAVSTKGQAEDDKQSLPTQQAQAEALCAERGWDIVDVLVVEGHSRAYLTIDECAKDMAAQGIFAFMRLMEMWETRGFDVLVCRSGDRFARSQALHAFIVEKTIQIGAKIFCTSDGGLIDERNFRTFAAMSGYAAASEIDRLKERRRIGMPKRAERGWPTGRVILFSHRSIYKEGKIDHIEVDEQFRSMWDDLADLIISGARWNGLETRMAKRGHLNPNTGKQYAALTFRSLLLHPYFWGNSAWGFNGKRGLWAFDPTESPPPGVTVYYGNHPSVYNGIQAEAIQGELRRRAEVVKGSVKPDNTYWFTGLFLCDECHTVMVGSRQGMTNGSRYIRCNTRNYRRYHDPNAHCSQSKSLRTDEAQRRIDEWLRWIYTEDDLDKAFSEDNEAMQRALEQVRRIEEEIEIADKKLTKLILEKVDATGMAARQRYTELINETDEKIQRLRERRQAAKWKAEELQVTDSQRRAAVTVGDIIDELWQLPETKINQLLHGIMGRWKFGVRDGHVMNRMMKIGRKSRGT